MSNVVSTDMKKMLLALSNQINAIDGNESVTRSNISWINPPVFHQRHYWMYTFPFDLRNVCYKKEAAGKDLKRHTVSVQCQIHQVCGWRFVYDLHGSAENALNWNEIWLGVSYCAKSYIVNNVFETIKLSVTEDTAKGVLLGVNTSRFNIHEMKCCVRRVQFRVQFVLRTFFSVSLFISIQLTPPPPPPFALSA